MGVSLSRNELEVKGNREGGRGKKWRGGPAAVLSASGGGDGGFVRDRRGGESGWWG